MWSGVPFSARVGRTYEPGAPRGEQQILEEEDGEGEPKEGARAAQDSQAEVLRGERRDRGADPVENKKTQARYPGLIDGGFSTLRARETDRLPS